MVKNNIFGYMTVSGGGSSSGGDVSKAYVDRQDNAILEEVKEDLTNYYNQLETNEILEDYYNKEEINLKFDDYYNKEKVEKLIGDLTNVNLKIVDNLPTSDISNTTIYLVKKEEEDEKNIYSEYLYIDDDWECIGDTKIDLSDYVKEEVLHEVAKSGDYEDLTNKPSMMKYYIKSINDTMTEPLTTAEFMNSLPLNTSFIARHDGLAGVKITDLPNETDYGVLMVIKGPTGNYQYCLFFDCNSGTYSNDIYYWSSYGTYTKGWKKINDGGNAETVNGVKLHPKDTGTVATVSRPWIYAFEGGDDYNCYVKNTANIEVGNSDRLGGLTASKYRGNPDFSFNAKNGGDLNDLKTEYHGFVFNMTNKPSACSYGFLNVDYFDGTGFSPASEGVVRQTYMDWQRANLCFVRFYKVDADTWTSWTKIGGNADTLEGIEADEFVKKEDIESGITFKDDSSVKLHIDTTTIISSDGSANIENFNKGEFEELDIGGLTITDLNMCAEQKNIHSTTIEKQGYASFPNGLYIEWGRSYFKENSVLSVDFQNTFSVTPTVAIANESGSINKWVGEISTTGITFWADVSNIEFIQWIAVGLI